ncbi:MAG: hypothetical protein ACI9KE_003511 [Polyangiales bacterium]|jgi:hypothetical protein
MRCQLSSEAFSGSLRLMPNRALFVVLVLGLSACGDTPPQEPVTPETETSVEAPEAEAPTPPSVEEANANPPEAAEEQPETEPEEPTLPTKMGRRLSNQLRQLVGARVALPQVVSDALPSGGSRVLGVMSFSEHEACVGRHEDRAEGRAECQTDEDCVQYGTFAAEFAAPRPRTPEGHGGALSLMAPQAVSDLNLVCAGSMEVQRLELVDIDGEIELMYDAIFRSDHDSFRGGGTFSTARHATFLSFACGGRPGAYSLGSALKRRSTTCRAPETKCSDLVSTTNETSPSSTVVGFSSACCRIRHVDAPHS